MKWGVFLTIVVLFAVDARLGFMALLGFALWFLLSLFFSSQSGEEKDDAWRQRDKPSPRRANHPPASAEPDIPLSDAEVHDLILLRLELERLHASGTKVSVDFGTCIHAIDGLLSMQYQALCTAEDNPTWHMRRNQAWARLHRLADHIPQQPPWLFLPQPPQPAPASAAPSVATPATSIEIPAVPPPSPTPSAPSPAPKPTTPPAGRRTEPAPVAPAPPLSPAAAPRPSRTAPLTGSSLPRRETPPETTLPAKDHYSWLPEEPSLLEKAMQRFSGWNAVLAPFLAQNIGWFIGGFLSLAGSIFLVSSTAGYARAFVIYLVLTFYALFLLWGGYQIRRRRPELVLSSGALLTLGVLLTPLAVASSARLILAGQDSFWTLLAAITASLAGLPIFLAAVTVASGVMDRSLQKQHPLLFIALTGSQLLTPVVQSLLPTWPVLAAAHLLLLMLLGYALDRFVGSWLHSIFLERRKIAYYAAGTLVYAGVVSFAHLTSSFPQPSPDGYYGPFLMLLAAILFRVDAEFKRWTQQHAYLSHFTFVVYGLSVLALAVVHDAGAARLITLLVALYVYASLMWRYLTLIPFALLLACTFWLYDLLVLQHFSAALYLVAGVPGLLSLYATSRWTLGQRSAFLTIVSYRALGLTLGGLTAWSLSHDVPGWTAFLTALIATNLAYLSLRSCPATLLQPLRRNLNILELGRYVDLRDTSILFAVTLMSVVALGFAPPLLSSDWTVQLAFGLPILAFGWIWTGLSRWQEIEEGKPTLRTEVLLNSALLGMALALTIVAFQWPLFLAVGIWPLALLLAALGGLSFWLGLNLYVRFFCYAAFLLWGVAGVWTKLHYFPEPSAGSIEMLLALAVGALNWWLGNEPDDIARLREEQRLLADTRPPLLLLWLWTIHPASSEPEADRAPL